MKLFVCKNTSFISRWASSYSVLPPRPDLLLFDACSESGASALDYRLGLEGPSGGVADLG